MTANSKAVQVRIEGATIARVGGQRAHDLRIGPQPDYVDQDRTPLNNILIEPLTGTRMREVCEERRKGRETKRALKSNAAVGVSGIITFGREAQKIFARLTRQEQDVAYLEIAEAMAKRLQTTLTGLVVHRDEAADHAHFQCPGVTLDGRPVSEIARRSCLIDLQTIAAQIIDRHAPGIERGTPRWRRIEEGESYAETVHKSAAEMRHRLPADLKAAREKVEMEQQRAQEIERRRIQIQSDLAALQAEIAAAHAKAAKNEELARKAREKAAAEDDAAAKRLEAYERRRAKAQVDAENLEARKAELEKLLGDAEQESAALEVELQEKRRALADQEETLQGGEELLARIEDEISGKETKRAEIRALDAEMMAKTAELEDLNRRVDPKRKEREQEIARDLALIRSAWDLAREGDFETRVTVEDLVAEGLVPNNAAAAHRRLSQGLGTRPLTKGWRIHQQILSGPGDSWVPRSSVDLDGIFYELRDICRRVRYERRDRLEHIQALEKAEEKSREALQREKAELEVREASLGRREQAAGLAEERLAKARAELEGLEAAAQRQSEQLRKDQATLDRRRAGEAAFLTAFQEGEVVRIGPDEGGQITFWRLSALSEEKKQALSAAWRQVGPELRGMLQAISDRRRELGTGEEALKLQDKTSALAKARFDLRRERLLRLALGLRGRRRTLAEQEAAAKALEISVAEREAKLEGLERKAAASRTALQKDLESLRDQAKAELETAKIQTLDEVRQNARTELEAQRQGVLAKAREEAEKLEASLLSDEGRQLKALRTENEGLRKNISAWRAFQDLLTAALKLLLGEERFASFRAAFMSDWETHPANPKRKEPDPPALYQDSGPSGP